jgi:cobalamin-dependent methionine synthase I
MIIIGEKLNGSIGSVKKAIKEKNESFIADLALKQADAGADYIDINSGLLGDKESEALLWMAQIVEKNTNLPLCIDSTNHIAIEEVLKIHQNHKPIINAITLKKEDFDSIAPIVNNYDTAVIALCMDEEGMPETAEESITMAYNLVEKLTAQGMKLEDIFIDPLVRPVGTGSHYGLVALETIKRIKKEFPEAHIACGLSNISFGIPARKLMNQTFLVAAMAYGMDGAILDPLDNRLMSLLLAADALLGRDEFCVNYISHYREGILEG